jgi:hypothetical protein
LEINKGGDHEICLFAAASFEWRYSEVGNRNTGKTPLRVKIEITHCDEMNDKIFDIDIDMNLWDNVRNVTEPISFHHFHRPSN